MGGGSTKRNEERCLVLRHFDAISDAPGTRYGRYVRLMDQPKALLKVRTERAGDKYEPVKIEDLIA